MKRPILMIILLLLLANAASIYWFTRHPVTTVETAEAPASTPTVIARLKLIAEVSPDQLIPATAAPETPVKTKPVVASTTPRSPPAPAMPARKPYCFVTPPFRTDAGDDAVLRTLAHIPDVEVNSGAPQQTIESTTYWVRLSGFHPLKEAMALVDELREKGVKDIATTPMKDRGTVVSLGLYRLPESATDRVREFKRMGYKTEIIELKKNRPGLRYRINILAKSESEAHGYLREYRNAFPDRPPKLQDCP